MKDFLVAIAVFVISFFSVISGGIGLLTRPLLILMGFPPSLAIGSFRVANLFSRLGGMGSLAVMGQRGQQRMDWKLARMLFVPSFIGGILGAEIVSFLDPEMIKRILGLFIILMGFVLLFKDQLGLIDTERDPSTRQNAVGFIGATVIGIIASFLGGSGILFAYLMIFVYNKSYLTSVPIRKIANLGSALSSAILFIWHGNANWRLVTMILISGTIGEFFGARFQIRHGMHWIRGITLTLVFISGMVMLLS